MAANPNQIELIKPDLQQGHIISYNPGIAILDTEDLYRIRAGFTGKVPNVWRLTSVYIDLFAGGAAGDRVIWLKRILKESSDWDSIDGNHGLANFIKSNAVGILSSKQLTGVSTSDYSNCNENSDMYFKLGNHWIISGNDFIEVEIDQMKSVDVAYYWFQFEFLFGREFNQQITKQRHIGKVRI